MRIYCVISACLAAPLFLINPALAQQTDSETPDTELETLIISASYLGDTTGEVANPIHVISGDTIANNLSESLGETLDSLLGVSSADYGQGVGHPIIRGLSGSRVRLLNNGQVVADLAQIGPDHPNEVVLKRAVQVEVVRGPSSLLYTNGTIGGIINVVDNIIARQDVERTQIHAGLESQAVNNGQVADFSYRGNAGGLNLAYTFSDTNLSDYDIPAGAILHHEEEEEDHAEEEVAADYLANSDFENRAYSAGLSKVFGWGHLGVSYSNSTGTFGLPFHAEEEEHAEDGEEEEEHADERIFSTTNSDTFTFEGSYISDDAAIKRLDYFIRSTTSDLTEQHAEEEHVEGEAEEEEEHEEPTLFENETVEYGILLDLSNGSFTHRASVRLLEEDISIVGAEAYLNPVAANQLSLGYYLAKDFSSYDFNLGVRYDQNTRDGSAQVSGVLTPFSLDFDSFSLAASLGKELSKTLTLNLGLAQLERVPTARDLFVNGPHLGTQRFEVGNINLNPETALNLDVELRYQWQGWSAYLAVFSNQISDYVYYQDDLAGQERDGLIESSALQQDADFSGYELQVGRAFSVGQGDLELSLGLDSVSATFTDGSYVPRTVPQRLILQAQYDVGRMSTSLTLKDVQDQKDVAVNETTTAGYSLLDFAFSYRFDDLIATGDLTLSVFAKNLLDETARNHTSFVKDAVPLPGRNLGLKIRYRY
ncbi:MAG: TonB-dependent receptor [Gammaproteobacteria bacterium]